MKSIETEIQTATGEYFDYANFTADDVNEEDVAYALNKICRFNGHCTKFYSVAKHLCLVHDLMDYSEVAFVDGEQISITKSDKFHGLIHDVGEAYLTDIPRPLKNYFAGTTAFKQFMAEYIILENKIIDNFSSKFTYDPHSASVDIVKYFDTWALLLEQKYLMADSSKEWFKTLADFPEEPRFVKKMLNERWWNQRNWETEFLDRLELYR